MPSKSPAQRRLFEAVAHDAAVAKKVQIPQSVGRKFASADEATDARHMAGRKGNGVTYKSLAKEFGTSKSTAHRKVAKHETLRAGYNKLGSAK